MLSRNFIISCKLIFTVYSVASIIFYLLAWAENIEDYIGLSLFLFSGQLILFFVLGRLINGGWLNNLTNPSYLALFGLLIVNLQNIINVYLGYGKPSDYSVSSLVNSVFAEGTCLCFLSTSIYILTLFLYNPAKIISPKIKQLHAHPLIWLCLLTISFFGFIAFSNIHEILSGAAYHSSNDEGGSLGNYFEGCINSFACIYLCETIILHMDDGGKNFRQFVRTLSLVFWGVIALYLLIRAISGDRGPVIYMSLNILFGYIYYSKKRFNAITVIAGVFSAAVIVTIMGIARQGAIEEAYGEKVALAIEKMSEDESVIKSVSPYTQELANSSQCTLIALEAHEAGAIDYQLGRYTFYNIVQTVPFAGGFLKNGLGFDWENVSSSSFITKRGLGPRPHYGLGTSAVADFYLEFGLLGVIIGFIIVAIIYKRIDYIFFYSIPVSPSVLIFSILFSSHAIYFARYSLSGLLYISVSTLVLYWICNFIIKLFRRC